MSVMFESKRTYRMSPRNESQFGETWFLVKTSLEMRSSFPPRRTDFGKRGAKKPTFASSKTEISNNDLKEGNHEEIINRHFRELFHHSRGCFGSGIYNDPSRCSST